jgi:hypothetical protein
MKEKHSCFYGCNDVATHQCPKCNQWYCNECYEMFLPIDNQNWQETNLMCLQCHYGTYEFNRLEAIATRRWQ